MHVEWGVVAIVAALFVVVAVAIIAVPIDASRYEQVPERPLVARREWTEDCAIFQHRDCQHIGSARTIGVLGRREFVTICGCPCHWGCPSEEVSLAEMSSECICSENGEVRQENFERFAKPPALDRILRRRRAISKGLPGPSAGRT